MSFEGTQYGHGRRSELVSAACKNPSQTETLEQRIDMLQTLQSFHFDSTPINSAPRFLTVRSCWAGTRSGLASAPSAPTLHLDKPGPPGKGRVVVCHGPSPPVRGIPSPMR